MNYGGGDQRYNGGGLTDGYDYEGEKNYYGQQSSQQLPSFPFATLRNAAPPPTTHHAYHGGLHQPAPGLLGDRTLPPMSSVARGGPTMPAADLGVGALSAAAAAHQMSRLGEAFKDSLAHHMQMGSSKQPGSMPSSAVGPYGVSVPYMPPQATSATGSSHSDRLYGGSAFSHAGSGSMGNSSLNEKSSPRSSRGSLGDAGSYGLSVPSPRGSIQLPAPSVPQSSQPTQLGGSGSAHQAAVSLSHIAGGGGHQSQSQAASQPQTAAPGRTAASMNPKDLLELYSKWDQIDTRGKSKNEETQAEEVRKERHNMAEKRRRSDMNGAIDRLKSLLPQQVTNDRRLTKVEVLLEAADHLTQVQNLCAKLITENKRLKAMIPGVKLEDDDDLTARGEDEAVEGGSVDGNNSHHHHSNDSSSSGRERRSSCDGDSGEVVIVEQGEEQGEGEDGAEKNAKRQRRGDSPGENSDSNGGGSGRDGEGSGSQESNGEGSSSSSNGGSSSSGSGEDEREEIVIDTRGEEGGGAGGDDDEGAEGRDSDNSNDGLTSKQRRSDGGHELNSSGSGGMPTGGGGEQTSFSGLTFPQDMQQQHQQQQYHMGHGLQHHQQQQQHHHLGQQHHHHYSNHLLHQHGQHGGM